MRSEFHCALAGCALLICSFSPCIANDLDAPGIIDVAHLDQLKAATPITTNDGWRLQVGLGEGGPQGGPWRLLYCLAKRIADTKEAPVERHENAETLGPVFFRVTQRAIPRQLTSRISSLAGRLPSEALYCQAIHIAWPGVYHIDLFAADGTLLARRLLNVEAPVACYWQPFAEMRRGGGLSSPLYITRNSAVAATVSFSELGPVWQRRPNFQTARRNAPIPLPGRLPADPFWTRSPPRSIPDKQEDLPRPLRLSLQDSTIIIASPVKLINWPDLHLLARWWVNDRPVIPVRSDVIKQISLGRVVTYSKRMRIVFRLPATLGDLKPGDTVGLQILFSPAIFKQLPKSRRSDALEFLATYTDEESVAVPLLSNRIEVKVTRELLSQRVR
jgi:hypothetical protein